MVEERDVSWRWVENKGGITLGQLKQLIEDMESRGVVTNDTVVRFKQNKQSLSLPLTKVWLVYYGGGFVDFMNGEQDNQQMQGVGNGTI